MKFKKKTALLHNAEVILAVGLAKCKCCSTTKNHDSERKRCQGPRQTEGGDSVRRTQLWQTVENFFFFFFWMGEVGVACI